MLKTKSTKAIYLQTNEDVVPLTSSLTKPKNGIICIIGFSNKPSSKSTLFKVFSDSLCLFTDNDVHL